MAGLVKVGLVKRSLFKKSLFKAFPVCDIWKVSLMQWLKSLIEELPVQGATWCYFLAKSLFRTSIELPGVNFLQKISICLQASKQTNKKTKENK